MKGNPFKDPNGQTYNRLLIKPNPKEATLSKDGVITPEEALGIFEVGIVAVNCDGSFINVGDEVVYAKIDRTNSPDVDKVVIDDVELDSIFENEVWSVNDKPFNRIYVQPTGDTQVDSAGVIAPLEAMGLPQTGVIKMAPPTSLFKERDIVRYRKREGMIYPTITIEGETYDVLFDTDIFTVNGQVSPYRIIVEIDMMKQLEKRTMSTDGVAHSPLFIHMKNFLQVGKITEIGSEAQKTYPDLSIGDYAILHHTVEHHPYRLLDCRYSKHNVLKYEYRIINAFDSTNREIFGVIKGILLNDREAKPNIIPFGENVFLKWHIDPFQIKFDTDDFSLSLSKYHDIEAFRVAIEKQKKEAADRYKMKFSAHQLQLQQLDPSKPENADTIRAFEHGVEELRYSAGTLAAYINKNHLVECRVVSASYIPDNMNAITSYAELYPIDIFGSRYLIANERFIYLTKTRSENRKIMKPFKGRIQVIPDETSNQKVIVPDSSRIPPSKGKVWAIGDDVNPKLDNANILFKNGSGYQQEIDGTNYLFLVENDILAFDPEKDA